MLNGQSAFRNFLCGVLALAAAGSLVLPAQAEHTRQWRQTGFEDFEKGTAKGIALRSDGKLVLAPRFASFADPNTAYLWALRADSKGNLYAAGGSNAKVLRFDARGAATTVFESAEMTAQALALDAQDNLYVGTSPDGKVYKVTPAGEKKIFFEPKTKYIWDLALVRDGTLYVATGDKGEIFAVKPDGKGQVFYTSEETHIRALAFDASGNLLAGTEPNGLILRISGTAPPRAFVLYETSRKEITALLVDRAGYTYAGGVGEKQRALPIPTPAPVVAPPPGAAIAGAQASAILAQAQAQAGQQPTPFVPFPPMVGGAVYRLSPEGAPEELWSSRDELVYALGFSPQGRLLIGTGNRGQLIELEENRVFSSLVKTASSQVTGIAQGPGGKVFLSTANPGKVFTLGPDSEPEGTFESQTYDAKIFSQWGRLEWWGDNGSAGGQSKSASAPQLALYVRSGNTSNPEKNWSPWAGPYTNGKGEKIEAPPARFVKWKAVFRSGGSGESAKAAANLSWASLSYLPKNVAPSIDAIAVQNPGIRLQSFAAATGGQPPQPVQLKIPPVPGLPSGFVPPAGERTARQVEPPPQGMAQKGYQAVLWSGHDDNDDELVYAIYYRGEGEKVWKLLKDKLDHKFYSWDTSTMPDGAYYLKIVASDAPSNPPEEALTAERESDRFEVDNTPPVVENLEAQQASPEVHVRFAARDSFSAIARAEYSLDGGDWKMIFPVGRLTDAPLENYDLALRGLAAGEHTVAVRLFDRFENTTTAKTTFYIQPTKP